MSDPYYAPTLNLVDADAAVDADTDVDDTEILFADGSSIVLIDVDLTGSSVADLITDGTITPIF